MKIKDYQCKCGHNDFFFTDKGSQKGIYCSYCGKWLKWADKDKQNLAMKQEPIIDKIRAEIISDIENGVYDALHGDKYASTYLCGMRHALEIIDKYKAESEE